MTNLKRIREAAGISQSKLAEASGVSVRMIQHYEQGFKDLNRAQAITVHRLAQALDCKVEDLVETVDTPLRVTKPKLTDNELADLFSYCATLSRLVSPRDAMVHFGFTFDGAVIDTLRGLAVMYDEDKDIKDFKSDELYGRTLEQMFSDIKTLLRE